VVHHHTHEVWVPSGGGTCDGFRAWIVMTDDCDDLKRWMV
jgi:hypothetical protein